MADIWMDVDADVVAPMNIMPLIDDTDFKSIETGLVYNSGGLVVLWNFVTTAGAQTQVQIHPTTGGVHDVAHLGNGMYSIEIPDSGGDHANNDTEGFGWISGVATGMLPWRGPVLGFRAAAINNALVDSATGNVGSIVSDLTIASSHIVATKSDLAVTDAVADAIKSDLIVADAVLDSVKSDLTVVDANVDSVLSDLTLAASHIVATKSDVAAITVQVGSMVPTTDAPDAFSQTAGSVIAGTFVKCQTDDNDRHILAPANPGGLDATYTFECGVSRAPVQVLINGYWNGSGQGCDVYAYDFGLAIWDKLTNSVTRMSSRSSDTNYAFPLNREHMDIDASVGQVLIRFVSTSTNTAHRLNLDAVLVATVATMTGAGSGSGGTPITPQDVWTYVERTLTSATGEPADTAAIADAVWADSDAVTLASNVVVVQSDVAIGIASISSDVTILPSELETIKSDLNAMRTDDVLEIEALILTRAVQAAEVQTKPPGGTILGAEA